MTDRLWGKEIVYANEESYSGTILMISENNRTAYFYNKKRSKTYFVLSPDPVIFKIEGKNKTVKQGESVKILPRVMCSLFAVKGDAIVLEVGNQIIDDVVIVEGA